jgi:hypothetical protein
MSDDDVVKYKNEIKSLDTKSEGKGHGIKGFLNGFLKGKK